LIESWPGTVISVSLGIEFRMMIARVNRFHEHYGGLGRNIQ
jgi:hypothetical protein